MVKILYRKQTLSINTLVFTICNLILQQILDTIIYKIDMHVKYEFDAGVCYVRSTVRKLRATCDNDKFSGTPFFDRSDI